MSGQGIRHEERISTSVRFRKTTRRAVDVLAIMLGGLSRDDMLQLLVRDGLAVAYERLGIESEPAAMAGELLAALRVTWENDLTDDELDAFTATMKALERIVQITARENPAP